MILGPSPMTLVTATQAPTSAATIGMTRPERAACASWVQPSSRGLEGLAGRDQACRTSLGLAASHISRGSKDSTASIVSTNRRKKKQARRRRHRHQRLKLDQGGGEGVDEHVDHRRRSGEPSRRRFLRAQQMLGACMESNFRVAVSG